MKVCQGFGVNTYSWPDNSEIAKKEEHRLSTKIHEYRKTLETFKELVAAECHELVEPSEVNPAGNSKLEEFRLFCMKEKAIYTILNQCEEGMALRVNVWYPAAEEAKIQILLKNERAHHEGQGAFLNPDRGVTKSLPPTYIKTNEYTASFQDVINTYGIPRYQEANPALLTVVTFPFIFGMMYGDVGHGGLLLLTGIFLCKTGESFRFSQPAVFGARYLVLSLGFFCNICWFHVQRFLLNRLAAFRFGFRRPGR